MRARSLNVIIRMSILVILLVGCSKQNEISSKFISYENYTYTIKYNSNFIPPDIYEISFNKKTNRVNGSIYRTTSTTDLENTTELINYELDSKYVDIVNDIFNKWHDDVKKDNLDDLLYLLCENFYTLSKNDLNDIMYDENDGNGWYYEFKQKDLNSDGVITYEENCMYIFQLILSGLE